MKKIVLATVLDFDLVSASWAAETINIRERVSNAQAPAHQIQLVSVPSTVQGETPRMAGMNQHEQVTIAHETVNDGSVEAHQKMTENHQKVMGNIAVDDTRPSVSLAAMNEHERATVAHETMNDDQSRVYQAMAETYRHMINAG